MKKTLAHLPGNKRNELKHIVSTVRGMCGDVEMIILFGSYARGDYKEAADLKPDRRSGEKSDYDILVVTREKSTATDIGLWWEIARKCDSAGLSADVRIITHDIQELNIKLAEGQYFYSDIRKEGCLLYDSENFKLAGKRKLKPEEQKRIARDYFEQWFESAETFYENYGHNISKDNKRKYLNNAAFNLHQVAEHSYKTILLVFTNYTPNEHLLKLLGHMASKHDSALKSIFPQETREEQRLFDLLEYAYIGARYDPAYGITREELEYLAERVNPLLDLTKKICKAKIESFTKKQPGSLL
ncbi:MAG: HEPN domain-containing protein [Victivallaceae bacterium]|nr:HEPN domain-containing protein [Victivallaceae bacterium]